MDIFDGTFGGVPNAEERAKARAEKAEQLHERAEAERISNLKLAENRLEQWSKAARERDRFRRQRDEARDMLRGMHSQLGLLLHSIEIADAHESGGEGE